MSLNLNTTGDIDIYSTWEGSDKHLSIEPLVATQLELLAYPTGTTNFFGDLLPVKSVDMVGSSVHSETSKARLLSLHNSTDAWFESNKKDSIRCTSHQSDSDSPLSEVESTTSLGKRTNRSFSNDDAHIAILRRKLSSFKRKPAIYQQSKPALEASIPTDEKPQHNSKGVKTVRKANTRTTFDEENKFVRQNEINVKSAQNYLSKDSSAVISPTNQQELSSADDDDSYGSLSVREEFNPITYEELLDIARENHLITQSSWCEYAQIENQKISMQTIRLPVSISSCFYVRGWSLKNFFDSVRTVEEKVKLTGKRDKENETLLSCEAHKEIAKQCIKKNCRGWIAFAKKHNEKVNKRVLVDKRVPQYFKLNGEWKGWDDFWGKK